MRTDNTYLRFLSLMLAAGMLSSIAVFAQGGAPKSVPQRQIYEGGEGFLKDVGAIVGSAVLPGSTVLLDGQRLYYDEGPGGKNPAVVVVDWGTKEGDLRIVQVDQGGKRSSGLVRIAPGPDALAAAIPDASKPFGQVETEIKALFVTMKDKSLSYDPKQYWTQGDGFVPGRYQTVSGAKIAYGLYRIWYAQKEYATAEAYFASVLMRCSWSPSLMHEWADFQRTAERPDKDRSAALARFLDTGDSGAAASAGQGLSSLVIALPKPSVTIAVKPNTDYDKYDSQKIERFMTDLMNYADQDARGILTYDLALFLSRRAGMDAKATEAATTLKGIPAWAALSTKLQKQVISDKASRVSIGGDPALAKGVTAEVAMYFKYLTE